MQTATDRPRPLRTALQRATVAVLCGSLDGVQRRSTWLHEQARLLGADDTLPGSPMWSAATELPRQRRAA